MYRRACLADVAAVRRVGEASYPPHFRESDATVAAIIALGLSWVYSNNAHEVVGYALVQKTVSIENPPHLNATAAVGSHVFIHDVCVLPAHRSCGIGKALAYHALASATHLVSLVSLEGAVWFWVQIGFTPYQGTTVWDYRTEYGDEAMLMCATISPHSQSLQT